MAFSKGLAIGGLISMGLMLSGCGPMEKMCGLDPLGFAAPTHHVRWRHVKAVTVPVSVTPEGSALSVCRQNLYLKSASSQDDMHALEFKCRAAILGQPY